jgi:hypothetical protein
MAGFGSTMSKLIEDDREYYRELATKKRDYLQTYGTKAVLDRDEKANGAVSLFNNLVTAGIPEDSLRYVLDTTGVAGLSELRSTLNSRTDLTKAEIEGLVKKSKEYVAENPDEDISTVIKRAYGLYKTTDKPVERESNLFSAVLGLDSRMMEDSVLQDLYVDGFSGSDIYRIMGSGGPKPGEALSLDLPTKPPSTQTLAASFKSLTTKFETSIDGQIKAATRANNPALVDKLEKIKARGVEGIYEYATLPEVGDPTLLDFAKRIELETPGAVSRNSIYLGGFTSQFNSWYGDQQDDAKLEGESNGPQVPVQTPTTAPVSFETANQFDAAVEAGEIEPGVQVKIGNSAPQTFSPPPSYKYKTKDAFPLEEDNRSRLLSETTDTMRLEEDDRSRLLSEATAPEPMTPASAQGQEHRELIADLGGAIAEGWESGNTLLTSSDAAGRGALFNGIANFVDYFGALAFNDMESSPLAGSLRKAAEAQKEKAAEIAAEGWAKYIEDKTGQEVPYTETEKAKELFSTRVAQYPMRLPGETPQGFMIRTGKQLPGPEVLTGEQSVEPLDITDYKSTMSTFIPQVLSRIDYGQNDVRDIKDILFELEPYSPDARNYGKGRTTIKTKEDLKDWLKPYFASRGIGVEFTPEQEKTFIDVTFDVYQQVQDMKEEGVLRRVQDQDRQFLADENNYPQPITGFVTPAKTEEEKKLEAEMVQVDEALRRVQDLDRQFLADENNYPQPISAMTSVDPLSINTRSDLRSAISERTGTMPPDYKEQMVSAVASVNEALKTFEDSVNIKTKNAIDAVSVSNINEAITNIVDRMFDTVVGNETLEDRIMKTEAGQNRAYALTKLQDQFGALTLFPERIPGEIDLGPTMGEIASEALHSTQDKINESIASAFKSLLSKIGIGKPEPLVRKPR